MHWWAASKQVLQNVQAALRLVRLDGKHRDPLLVVEPLVPQEPP